MLKRTKPGRAAGVDQVCLALLRDDMEDTASRLTSCYNSVWETKRWPKLWKKEVVEIFEKDSLREYNN